SCGAGCASSCSAAGRATCAGANRTGAPTCESATAARAAASYNEDGEANCYPCISFHGCYKSSKTDNPLVLGGCKSRAISMYKSQKKGQADKVRSWHAREYARRQKCGLCGRVGKQVGVRSVYALPEAAAMVSRCCYWCNSRRSRFVGKNNCRVSDLTF